MTTAPIPLVMTADELIELPDDGIVYELSRGVLICMSPSSYGASRVAGRVVARIGAFVDAHQARDYGSAEGGFRLASDLDTVRAPDAWFVRAERVPPGENPVGFY